MGGSDVGELHMPGKSEPSSLEEAVRTLTSAIEADDLEVLRRVLEARPEVAQRAQPLLLACGLLRLEAVRALLDAGADPNLASRPSGGVRPLSRLCELHAAGRIDAWPAGALELAELLVERGADPTRVSHEGDQSPLLLAARLGNADAVRFLRAKLAERGLEPDLWEAATLGEAKRIRAALGEDKGWATRARVAGAGPFKMSWTLLTLTAQSRLGNCDPQISAALAEQTVLLLAAGAPIAAAQQSDDAIPCPCALAAAAGNLGSLKVLLAAGGDPNPALAAGIQGEAPEVLEVLASYPLALDQSGNPKTGASLLHQLALWGRFRQAAWLLERGANPNPRDDEGLTPLHYAVRRGCPPNAVECFLAAGADPWLKDRHGRTVIDLAREKAREQLYPLLESAPRSA